MSGNFNAYVRSLAKSGVILLAGLGFELIISFVAKVIIARYLGTSDFGEITLGVTLITVCSIIVVLGLDTGIARYLPRAKTQAEYQSILQTGFILSSFFGVLVAAILVIYNNSIAIALFNNKKMGIVVAIFGLVLPFSVLKRITLGTLQGEKLSMPKLVVQRFAFPISRFLLISVVLILGFGRTGAAYAYALPFVIAGTTGYYYVQKNINIEFPSKSFSLNHDLLSFSLPLALGGAMGLIFSQVDTLMIGFFHPEDAVGIYDVGFSLANLLSVGLMSIAYLFMPIVSELHQERNWDTIRRLYQVVTKWVVLSTLPIFLVFIAYPSELILWTFGNAYMNADLVIPILSVAFFIHAVAGPNESLLTSFGMSRSILFGRSLAAILNFALNLFLIPRYSYLGAAIGSTIAYVTLNIAYSVQLYKKFQIHPFTWSQIIPSLLGASIFVIFIKVSNRIFEPNILMQAGTIGLYLLAYLLVVLKFGGIETEERMILLSIQERFNVNLEPAISFIDRWFL